MIMDLLKAQARYGEIQNGVWGFEKHWMMLYALLPEMKGPLAGWINTATGQPVTHIYMNTDFAAPFEAALRHICYRGLAGQLKTFDGCWNIRPIRGEPNCLSEHAYGNAIDINAATNVLGQTPTLSPELVQCFDDAKLFWGGRFKRLDGMHVALCGW
jgi:hypothetical protein